jgi:hypothetical protein
MLSWDYFDFFVANMELEMVLTSLTLVSAAVRVHGRFELRIWKEKGHDTKVPNVYVKQCYRIGYFMFFSHLMLRTSVG